MLRTFIVLPVLIFFLSTGCSGTNDAGDEAIFSGVWVKGNQYGDTLIFLRKNNKNILQYNQSHNPGLLLFRETEYTYKNGRLSAAVLGGTQPLTELSGFVWKQQGKIFDVYESALYPFVATMAAPVSFTKIN